MSGGNTTGGNHASVCVAAGYSLNDYLVDFKRTYVPFYCSMNMSLLISPSQGQEGDEFIDQVSRQQAGGGTTRIIWWGNLYQVKGHKVDALQTPHQELALPGGEATHLRGAGSGGISGIDLLTYTK